MSVKKLIKNSGSGSIAILFSRILGLVRDQIFAYLFGTSYVADAFNLAFTIPNLLRRLFGEGALSAAFIPIYIGIGNEKGEKKQILYGIQILYILTLFLTFLCLIGIAITPLIVKFMAPGFSQETTILATKLTRLLFPYLFFIGISSTFIAILNTHGYYFLPGLSSAFLNIGIIGTVGIGVLFFDADPQTRVYVFASGVLIGGFLQTIINLPLMKKSGYSFQIIKEWNKTALLNLWKKYLPGVFGIAVRQINLVADKLLASLLIVGSISALNYGNRLMQLPLGIFGAAIGTAVIPHFSKSVAKKDWHELSSKIRFSLIILIYIMIPMILIMIVLGKDIIRLLFLRGEFGVSALQMSYNALLWYSSGLLFYGWNRIIVPIFYAHKDTKTPVKIATIVVFINVILNIVLMHFFALSGLALATAISAMIQYFILTNIIKKKYVKISYKSILPSLMKILISATIVFPISLKLKLLIPGNSIFQLITRISFVGFSVFSLFVFFAFVLRVDYIEKIKIWKK